MKNEEIVLIGGGGHCKSCIDVIEAQDKFRIAGIVDEKEKLNEKVFGYKIFATDDDLPNLVKNYNNFFVTIGQIKQNDKRIKLFIFLNGLGASFPVIISPRAYVSKHASLGQGTIVHHNVVINAKTNIGRNCIINTNAVIEHDVFIGDFCHISTSAVINGGAIIGKGSFIGSNASVREGIEIGSDVFIGMQKKIYKNIDDNSNIK